MKLTFSELVIASHNQGKIREIRELLSALPITVRGTDDFPQLKEPEETEDSFAGNAVLKAAYVSTHTNLPALADDSGLVIPALKGEPGIFSARWAGETKDFKAAMQKVQQELLTRTGTDVNHSAYFHCALALVVPHQPAQVFEGQVYGILTFPPRGDAGFGYDPIFLPAGYKQTFGQMEPSAKHAISHRARAFAKFLAALTPDL